MDLATLVVEEKNDLNEESCRKTDSHPSMKIGQSQLAYQRLKSTHQNLTTHQV